MQAQTNIASKQGLVDLLLEYLDARYPQLDLGQGLIYVSLEHQRLYHVMNGRLNAEYAISTAERGPGNEMDSERTPTGLHRVHSKIGDQVPFHGVLRSREYQGEIWDSIPNAAQQDLVTTRLLWLDGAEPGVNNGGEHDTFKRFIYIHGTPDEASIGKPASHGCVRMLDEDVAELYHMVDEGTYVVILDN